MSLKQVKSNLIPNTYKKEYLRNRKSTSKNTSLYHCFLDQLTKGMPLWTNG